MPEIFTMLIPCSCVSSSDVGASMRVQNSNYVSGMKHIGMLSHTVNPGSKGSFRTLCPCNISPHVFRNFQQSLPPDRKRFLHLRPEKMNATTHVLRDKLFLEKVAMGSRAEALTTRAIHFCERLPVLVVMLSTVLGGTPAEAGVESTFQPKFNGLVDATTNRVSSVEAILAKQLARRFREMSDEELVLVLQELLKASRSSINPEDLLLDGRGRKDLLLEDESKEDNRKPVDDGIFNKDRASQSKGGGESRTGGLESLSAPSSKFVDSGPKQSKEDSHKPGDDEDEVPEPKGGSEAKTGALQPSAPSSKFVDPNPKREKPVVPGTVRAPSSVKGAAAEEASTTKKSGSIATGESEGGETEQSTEESSSVGEIVSESEDMTGILWEEWKRRLEGQKIPELTTSEESSTAANAADMWKNMQTSTMRVAKGASDFSSWISENREALGGGVLASGSTFLVWFIRQKFLSFSSEKANKNGAGLKVDRMPTKAQPSASNQKDSGQERWSFLQAVPTSFKAARSKLLGTEDTSAQTEESSSGSTTNSDSSVKSTTSVPNNVPWKVESATALRQLRKASDKQADRGNNDMRMRYETGLETSESDAAYGSGLDDMRSFESSKFQGRKSGKEDDATYKIHQIPSSNSAVVDDSRRSWGGREVDADRYSVDDSPFSGIRRLPLTSTTREERGIGGKSYRGGGQSSTVSTRSAAEPRENLDDATSDRTQDVGANNSIQPNLLQTDSTDKAMDSKSKRYSSPELMNRTSSRPSSRSIQVDPLAHRRETPNKEGNEVELRDRFAAGSILPDEMEEGSASIESVNTKSTSVLSGSDRSDGNEGRPSPPQFTQGEEVTSDCVRLEGSTQGETFSSINGGLNRLDEYGMETESPLSTYTEETHRSLLGKQEPVRGDTFTNARMTLVRDADEVNVLDEAEDVEYTALNEGDNAGGAEKHMETHTKDAHAEMVNDMSPGTNVPIFSAEHIPVGENVSKGTSTKAPDTTEIESTRELWEASEEEVQDGNVAEIPISSDLGATQISQEQKHDERMIDSAASERRMPESAISQDEGLGRVSAPNKDAGESGRSAVSDSHGDDVWASGRKTAIRAERFGQRYADATREKPDDFGASTSGGMDFQSKRADRSRPELDSFMHNQNMWVRDSDGVFIKHPRESQEREGSRVTGNVRGSSYEVADAATAPKRASTKVNRDPKLGSKARLQKQKRGISSGFDYRQLYLTPNEDNESRGQENGPRTSGSKKYTPSLSPTDTGKTRPIRYGVEGTL